MKMNVDAKTNTLTITVDLKQDLGPSSSGKTVLIDTTKGAIGVPGVEGSFINLNVYRKP